MGEYTVIVKGNQAEASWSNDGMNTSGGLEAEAYGPEQLHMLSYDYAGTMDKLVKMGVMPHPAGVKTPNPRLAGGEITDWTEEDQAEADRAQAEADAENEARLAEIAKAEKEGSMTVEEAVKSAKEAIVQEYKLTDAQARKLTYEADQTTYVTYQEGQPLVHLMFWLWQEDEGPFTEKDGQYWVTINLQTGVIEDILYDAGLAGNG
jgi:hypothetical protein